MDLTLRKTVKRIDTRLCLLLLAPLLLFFSNQEWFFPYGNPTDSWLNESYFADYGSNPLLFVSYKAARLSWILKGWLAHHLFSPLTGYYVLNFFIFYTCIIAFYYIVKLLFNRNVALLAGLAFATYSQFHSIISYEWDYHTHDAMANILLTLLFLVLATRRPHWKTYVFFAGTMCASAIQSPFVMIYFFSVVFWYWFLNRQQAKHSFWISTVMFGLGGIAMTLFYCVVSYSVGGPFLYFLVQVPGHAGWAREIVTEVYNPSYWQPFSTLFLHNKGIVIPTLTLLASIGSYIYLIKKRPSHPHRAVISLCFLTFFVSIPIPTIFQIFGWATLNLPQFILGMGQFVFLAMGAIIATFLPEPVENKSPWGWLFFAFVILCGVLIFSLNAKSLLNSIPLNMIGFIRMGTLLSMLALLGLREDRKKMVFYLPLATLLTVNILFQEVTFRHHWLIFTLSSCLGMIYFLWKVGGKQLSQVIKVLVLFFGVSLVSSPSLLSRVFYHFWRISISPAIFTMVISILSCLAMFYFLWKIKKEHLSLTIKVVILFSFAIILLPSRHHGNIMAFPLILTVLASSLLLLPLLCFFLYRKKMRKYSIVAGVSMVFAIGNLYSASIPTAFYAYHFKCVYFKDQYVAVLKGRNIIRKFDSHYSTNQTYLWFRAHEVIPYPNIDCQRKNLAGVYGFPIIDMAPLYGAVIGSLYQSVYPATGDGGLFHYTLNNMPNAAFWKKFAPKMMKDHPNLSFVHLKGGGMAFSGYLGCSTFSNCKGEKFWVHVFPSKFRLAILSHTLKDNNIALHSLEKYGAYMQSPQVHHVKEGIISYYITIGVVKKVKKNV